MVMSLSMRRALAAALLVVCVVSAAACSKDDEASTSTTKPPTTTKLRVVTTTPILTDFATIIGGDRVEVYNVVKPNADPHDYEPTPADITALGTADVIIKNGLGLETWFDDTMKNAESDALVVDASDGITPRYENVNGVREADPHIWHSPLNARLMVANIREGLMTADANDSKIFQDNERAYDAQLDALRTEIARSISPLPNKNLVTNHDSLGYYVDEFKLNYVGSVIPSFDSQAELSSVEITELVAKIKAQNVKAVFSESSLPSKTAETIASEAGVKVVQGPDALYGDSLGAPGTDADTYLKMERHNTNVIASNLR